MEKIGDFLPNHRHGMLGRILLATQLEKAIRDQIDGDIRVVIKLKTITLTCVEAAYAQRLTLERRKLEAILTRLAGPRHGFTLKIRAGS